MIAVIIRNLLLCIEVTKVSKGIEGTRLRLRLSRGRERHKGRRIKLTEFLNFRHFSTL